MFSEEDFDDVVALEPAFDEAFEVDAHPAEKSIIKREEAIKLFLI